jgi:hypothetical protein
MLSKHWSNPMDRLEPQNHENCSSELPGENVSRTVGIYTGKAVGAAGGIGVLALSAVAFYRVREILAALLLFSVLLGVVIFAILIMWLVGEATHEAATRLEKYATHIPARHTFAVSPPQANPIFRNRQ